ncbi:MAG: hypothetical protein RLZZ520_370 [Bacteroidota bacterium]
MKRNNIYVTLLLVLLMNTSYGQATKSDPIDKQGWFSAGVDFDLPKKWKAEVEYQARMFNDLKTFNGSFYSLGIEKGLSSWFALQAEYRLANVLKGTYNRISAGFVLDEKVNEVKLDLRVLYQNQIQDFDDPAKENDKNNFIRIRMRGKKEMSDKVDLVLSFEPIYQLQSGLQIDNYRLQGGLKYHFTKSTTVDAFYLNRPDYAKSYKRQYHVFGIAFKHEIKIK